MSARRRLRIAVVTGLPLAQNPRAAREAAALARGGHEVIVLGAELIRETLETDQSAARHAGYEFVAVGSLRPRDAPRRIVAWCWRLRHRLGRDAYRLFRLENAYQIGYFVPELTRAALRLAADYYVVHAEQGLWAGAVLLREGRVVGVDVEDWYSEDLLPSERALRPLRRLRQLEATLLLEAAHSSCPSHAMSVALEREYGCRAPLVIYNASSWAARTAMNAAAHDRKNRMLPSIHWFSQTVGAGRGLDDLAAALSLLEYDVEVHLRGTRAEGFDEWLGTRVPPRWRSRIFIHDAVPANELLVRVSEHDIGFAGEQKYCRNKELTVSNKILTYLAGGLAVLASDTAGQSEVAARAGGAIRLYEAGNPRSLATELNAVLGRPDELGNMKSAALKAAEEIFNWEKMEPVLVQAVQSGLTRASVREGHGA